METSRSGHAIKVERTITGVAHSKANGLCQDFQRRSQPYAESSELGCSGTWLVPCVKKRRLYYSIGWNSDYALEVASCASSCVVFVVSNNNSVNGEKVPLRRCFIENE